MQFFVGLDVALQTTSICVTDERGIIIKEGKVERNPQRIARFVRHQGRKIEHVVEICPVLPSLDQWSVPINFMVTKLTKFGDQPVSIQAGVKYWADSPDSGPHGVGGRLALTFIFS